MSLNRDKQTWEKTQEADEEFVKETESEVSDEVSEDVAPTVEESTLEQDFSLNIIPPGKIIGEAKQATGGITVEESAIRQALEARLNNSEDVSNVVNNTSKLDPEESEEDADVPIDQEVEEKNEIVQETLGTATNHIARDREVNQGIRLSSNNSINIAGSSVYTKTDGVSFTESAVNLATHQVNRTSQTLLRQDSTISISDSNSRISSSINSIDNNTNHLEVNSGRHTTVSGVERRTALNSLTDTRKNHTTLTNDTNSLLTTNSYRGIENDSLEQVSHERITTIGASQVPPNNELPIGALLPNSHYDRYFNSNPFSLSNQGQIIIRENATGIMEQVRGNTQRTTSGSNITTGRNVSSIGSASNQTIGRDVLSYAPRFNQAIAEGGLSVLTRGGTGFSFLNKFSFLGPLAQAFSVVTNIKDIANVILNDLGLPDILPIPPLPNKPGGYSLSDLEQCIPERYKNNVPRSEEEILEEIEENNTTRRRSTSPTSETRRREIPEAERQDKESLEVDEKEIREELQREKLEGTRVRRDPNEPPNSENDVTGPNEAGMGAEASNAMSTGNSVANNQGTYLHKFEEQVISIGEQMMLNLELTEDSPLFTVRAALINLNRDSLLETVDKAIEDGDITSKEGEDIKDRVSSIINSLIRNITEDFNVSFLQILFPWASLSQINVIRSEIQRQKALATASIGIINSTLNPTPLEFLRGIVSSAPIVTDNPMNTPWLEQLITYSSSTSNPNTFLSNSRTIQILSETLGINPSLLNNSPLIDLGGLIIEELFSEDPSFDNISNNLVSAILPQVQDLINPVLESIGIESFLDSGQLPSRIANTLITNIVANPEDNRALEHIIKEEITRELSNITGINIDRIVNSVKPLIDSIERGEGIDLLGDDFLSVVGDTFGVNTLVRDIDEHLDKINSIVGTVEALLAIPNLIRMMDEYNIPALTQLSSIVGCLDLFNRVRDIVGIAKDPFSYRPIVQTREEDGIRLPSLVIGERPDEEIVRMEVLHERAQRNIQIATEGELNFLSEENQTLLSNSLSKSLEVVLDNQIYTDITDEEISQLVLTTWNNVKLTDLDISDEETLNRVSEGMTRVLNSSFAGFLYNSNQPVVSNEEIPEDSNEVINSSDSTNESLNQSSNSQEVQDLMKRLLSPEEVMDSNNAVVEVQPVEKLISFIRGYLNRQSPIPGVAPNSNDLIQSREGDDFNWLGIGDSIGDVLKSIRDRETPISYSLEDSLRDWAFDIEASNPSIRRVTDKIKFIVTEEGVLWNQVEDISGPGELLEYGISNYILLNRDSIGNPETRTITSSQIIDLEYTSLSDRLSSDIYGFYNSSLVTLTEFLKILKDRVNRGLLVSVKLNYKDKEIKVNLTPNSLMSLNKDSIQIDKENFILKDINKIYLYYLDSKTESWELKENPIKDSNTASREDYGYRYRRGVNIADLKGVLVKLSLPLIPDLRYIKEHHIQGEESLEGIITSIKAHELLKVISTVGETHEVYISNIFLNRNNNSLDISTGKDNKTNLRAKDIKFIDIEIRDLRWIPRI